jgi:hypothetical protein
MAGNLPFSEKLGSDAIGPEERWFSAAAGACLVGYGLSRISLRSLAAMAVGGYLVYRGSTGKCPIGDKLTNASSALNDVVHRYQGQGGCCQSSANGAVHEQPADMTDCCDDAVDPVDEAAMESFPASDPPSFSTGTSTPSAPIQ